MVFDPVHGQSAPLVVRLVVVIVVLLVSVVVDTEPNSTRKLV